MPYHIYLKPKGVFNTTLTEFYSNLNSKYGEIESLQYPPHVTITYTFDTDGQILNNIEDDLKFMFSLPFNTKPKNMKIKTADKNAKYHRIVFDWDELGYRIEFLKHKYINVNWKTYDYHLTLVDGTSDDILNKTKKILPSLPKSFEFDIVLYEYKVKQDAASYSELKTWTELFSIPITL